MGWISGSLVGGRNPDIAMIIPIFKPILNLSSLFRHKEYFPLFIVNGLSDKV